MGLKFLAYFLTNSNAILTDALESIINVITAGFAFYSIYLSSRPRDFEHPYGHGKIEFFSAGFEGALIMMAAFAISWAAVQSLLYPKILQEMPAGLGIISITAIINGILGMYLHRYGKNYNSLTLLADGKHLLSDAVSSSLLVLGITIIIFTGQQWIDSLLSFIFALLLLREGYHLVRKSVAGLMDETDKKAIEEVLVILNNNRRNSWIDVHNLRVQHYGADWHIDCHLTLPYYLSLRQTHDEVEAFREAMVSHKGKNIEIFIHADPCLPPENCKACAYQNCHVRQHAHMHSPEWNIENVTQDAKHFRKLV